VLVDLPPVVAAEDDVEPRHADRARISRHRWFPQRSRAALRRG
jgi:hypothetical protein